MNMSNNSNSSLASVLTEIRVHLSLLGYSTDGLSDMELSRISTQVNKHAAREKVTPRNREAYLDIVSQYVRKGSNTQLI
jgi:hypothetical protein